nr:TIGR03364 family FAD-dependent oxidoreductase [Conyzicola lurida]
MIVVGAGIVGLGAALEGVDRGLRVAVVERAAAITGSSVRNFGHIGVTGQSGAALEYALETRSRLLRLGREAGLSVSQRGATIAARGSDELALLALLAEERGSDQVVLATAAEFAETTPVRDPSLSGGAYLPLDLQVDPRTAAPQLAAWLEERGVTFHWRRAVLGIEPGTVHTAAGELHAERIVVAVNFDVDQFFPEVAAAAQLRRCGLDMLALDWSGRRPLDRPLLTGSSMLRYSAFAQLDGYAALRDRYRRDFPAVVDLDINQMYTQRPTGQLIVGDTHYRGDAILPFQAESSFDELLALTRGLFGVDDLRVVERWQGVYASAPDEFLLHSPGDGVRVASVTTGIGMTTGLGLAASVVRELL